MSWNVSSIKPQTFNVLRQIQPHIMCLQETRNYEMKNTPSFNYVSKIRDTKSHGGGICIGINSRINYRSLDDLIPQEIKDLNCEIQLVQVFHSLFKLIIINAYIPSMNIFGKRKRNQLQKWIMTLISSHTEEKFIICGDFNSTETPFPLLYNMNAQNLPTFQRRQTQASTLDYILTSFKCLYDFLCTEYHEASDHKVLEATINLEVFKGVKRQSQLLLPSKEKSLIVSQQAADLSTSQDEFFKNISEIRMCKDTKPFIKIRVKLLQREGQKLSKQQISNILDNCFRTKFSIKAFNWVKRLSILNPNKRDGGLVTCQINEKDGKIITENSVIQQNCLHVLHKLSDKFEYVRSKHSSFPNLPPISTEQAIGMQKQISSGKAVTCDGFIDVWFKNTPRTDLLTDWWNQKTMEALMPVSFQARLIPLNKSYPNIPTIDQFRPIAVLSSALKWIELRFKDKLQDYVNNYIDKDQNGFITASQTNVNTKLLIEEIKKYTKASKMAVLFVDLKSAYNTIDRDKLFQILKERNILSQDESDFLKQFYNNIYFISESSTRERHYLKNGVQQGGILSPLLFDIYMDEVLKQTLSGFKGYLFKKVFADDLVTVIKERDLAELIERMKDTFNKFKLIFNNSKSQIIIVRGEKQGMKKDEKDDIISGLSVVSGYNYLGIRIDNRGSMECHLTYLRQRCAYLEGNMKFYARDLSFKNKYLLWIAYIRSLFCYCISLLPTQTQTLNAKFKSLYNQSFKRFMNLPKNTPAYFLDYLLEDFEKLKKRMSENLNEKIEIRYSYQQMTSDIDISQLEYQSTIADSELAVLSEFDLQKIKYIPDSLIKLTYFQRYQCSCHKKILCLTNILTHAKVELTQQFKDLFVNHDESQINNSESKKMTSNYKLNISQQRHIWVENVQQIVSHIKIPLLKQNYNSVE